MASLPNIIVFTSHDIGQHIGPYGIETVQTPNFDRLAAEGVTFLNSYCTVPSCSPSRASIFTGRYPHNNGVLGLCHANFAWDLHSGEKHLVRYLKELGYDTTLHGVCHETRHPERLGFDRILPVGPAEQMCQIAAENIRERTASAQPFYLQIGTIEPHRTFPPGNPPEGASRNFYYGGGKPDREKGVTIPPFIYPEPSSEQDFAEYQGSIRLVDDGMGVILNVLDELNLSENTLVLYASDHGMPFPRAKCSLYNPGLQVAFLLRYPARGWSGGKRYSELVSNIDYLPTLLELLQVPIPNPVQGTSLVPLLDAQPHTPRDAVFGEMTYHDYYDPRRCVITPTHKLIANFTTAHFFMDPSQAQRPSSIAIHPKDNYMEYHPDLELYDLTVDPNEFNNVADNPDYADIRADLLRKLGEWMQETDDILLHDQIPVSPQHQRASAALRTALKSG
ncbi:MAG: sulfatase [Anaerolineaceae bacterium]|nr:sulfatase [Anaerolineaceae bacterium]